MSKESYNPFKMWGSYLGAGLTIGISFLIEGFCSFSALGGKSCSKFLESLTITQFNTNPFFRLAIILIIGFLIGWGIHSFFRKIT